MSRLLAALSSVAFVCLAASPAVAQDAGTDAPPAHIAFVEGTVVLERDGKPDPAPASMPLLAGDRIRTQAGRVEVLFADGSALHVDQHSVVDFQSDEVIRLLDGRMRLNIAGQGRDLAYRVDAPAAWVQIAEAGEYRVAVLRADRETQVELAVLRGAAELVNEDGRSLVRAGERAFARAGAQPSPPYVFNSAAWDAFDRWSESRRDERLGASAQHLPPDVRPYSAAFDQYGAWRYEQPYGYVWYPRVRGDWRPYYHGRWASLRPYGWTWIAADPWGWPTHHYGRWGYSTGAWFWIPGRRWGAAWVSWAYAPDYVSWCPLGWDDRPLFSFVSVNLFGGRRYDPWRAWTVLPRRHFGRGYVHANVISAGRLDHRTRGLFVVRESAPDWRDHAVPRASTAIRTAGTRTGYAIPRGSGVGGAPGVAASRSDTPGVRTFPTPAREPRDPSFGGAGSARSSAPVTAGPARAVPRDRARERDGYAAGDRGQPGSTAYRRAPQSRTDGGVRADDRVTIPDGARAVPRRESGADVQRDSNPGWRRHDRPSAGSAAPDVYRRAPDRGVEDRGRIREEHRAIPRQDAPPPSYEPRRESPPPSRGEAPTRSYGSPGAGSPSRSYGAPERRAPSGPSADRPSRSGDSGSSRSAPSGDGGQSRSRGDRPSSGQATRRPGGRQ